MPWFVMIPPAYQNADDASKEKVDLRVEYTDPRTIAAVEAGQIVSAARGYQDTGFGGQDLVKWKGPFATEADARTAQAPKQQSANPFNDAVFAAAHATGFLDFATNVWAAVSSGKMWRSLGWILLGIVLMLLGAAWWIGPSSARMSPLGAAASAGRRLG